MVLMETAKERGMSPVSEPESLSGTYVNKTLRVFQCIKANPEIHERDLVRSLDDMSEGAIYAAIKSLVENGHVAKTDTQELNKRKRPFFRLKAIPGKPYQPTHGTRKDQPSSTSGKGTDAAWTQTERPNVIQKPSIQEGSIAKGRSDKKVDGDGEEPGKPTETQAIALTVTLGNGEVMKISVTEARMLYQELKKLFES